MYHIVLVLLGGVHYMNQLTRCILHMLSKYPKDPDGG